MNAGEAQYRLLYAVMVAGKKAKVAEQAMNRFLDGSDGLLPFDWVAYLDGNGLLETKMREARTGSYTRLTRSFREIGQQRPDLFTARPDELEQFHGIGPKTARFAIIWVRPAERFAALDRHVLKWLRFLGVQAPMSTPSGALYAELERTFIAEADKRELSPRMLDAMIWQWCSDHGARKTFSWPAWLQKEPAFPPPHVLKYFESFVK